MRVSPLKGLAAGLIALVAVSIGVAHAHPHVWVMVKETVLYKDGAITGLRQSWTFDEYYTEMAIEGLDKNGDGKYDREELKELAQVNIDGLKEFSYFTFAKAGDKDLKFKPPEDYWLEHDDKGVLTLHMTLPLEEPVVAEASGFQFSVFDSSYYIAFDLAETDPVTLGAGAPASCKAAIHDPPPDDEADDLNAAFSSVLGDGGTIDMGSTRSIAVECSRT